MRDSEQPSRRRSAEQQQLAFPSPSDARGSNLSSVRHLGCRWGEWAESPWAESPWAESRYGPNHGMGRITVGRITAPAVNHRSRSKSGLRPAICGACSDAQRPQPARGPPRRSMSKSGPRPAVQLRIAPIGSATARSRRRGPWSGSSPPLTALRNSTPIARHAQSCQPMVVQNCSYSSQK